jgi:hypothetical protein
VINYLLIMTYLFIGIITKVAISDYNFVFVINLMRIPKNYCIELSACKSDSTAATDFKESILKSVNDFY